MVVTRKISDLISTANVTGSDLFVTVITDPTFATRKATGEQLFNYITSSITSLSLQTLTASISISGTLGLFKTLTGSSGHFMSDFAAANSKFQINNSGNIIKVNDITTVFPAAQGGANTTLLNNGAGTLSWSVISSSIISNFTSDVRSQFSAGTNVSIVDGVISATGGGGGGGDVLSASNNTFTGINTFNNNYITASAGITASNGKFDSLSASLVSSPLIPSTDIAYDLGSSANRWRDLYLSGSTIYLGTAQISVIDNKLTVNGNQVVTGTISGGDGTSINATAVTSSNILVSNDLKVLGTASITQLNTLNQTSLVVGDKYITILSGGVDHTGINGAGFLWGSSSGPGETTGTLGEHAHITYDAGRDALEIFPGLYVTGSTTLFGVSGTVAQFMAITASIISASQYIGVAAAGITTTSSNNTFTSVNTFTNNYVTATIGVTGSDAKFTTVTASYVAPQGNASSPSFAFSDDPNTGIYSPAADTIAFVEGGSEVVRITAAGNVGIGTSTPNAKLDVNGNIFISGSGNGIKFPDGTTLTTAGASNTVSSFKLPSSPYNLTASTDNAIAFFGASTVRITPSNFPALHNLKKIDIYNTNNSSITLSYPQSLYDNSTYAIQQGAGGNSFISASDKAGFNRFGYSVSMNDLGDRVVIGSNISTAAGKVYVYVSGNTDWVQQGAGGNAFITASDGFGDDGFGNSVGINSAGNIIVVGAPRQTPGVSTAAGKVYVYASESNGWSQQGAGGNPFISASDKLSNDNFGYSVAINSNGQRIVVGSPKANPGANDDAGKVYVYISGNSGWVQYGGNGNPFISASDKQPSGFFGSSVAMNNNGDCIAVGAPNATAGGVGGAGKVYIYVSGSGGWFEQSIVTASDKFTADNFGTSVAMNALGNRIVVGAPLASSIAADSGKVYVYVSGSNGWTQQGSGGNSFISASNGSFNDQFGDAVSMNGDGDRISVTGGSYCYVYVSGNNGWTQQGNSGWSVNTGSFISASDSTFGFDSIDMSSDGKKIITGTPNDTVGALSSAGTARIFLEGQSSSLPYFSGYINEWPTGFADRFQPANNTEVNSTSNRITVISDGTSWWII